MNNKNFLIGGLRSKPRFRVQLPRLRCFVVMFASAIPLSVNAQTPEPLTVSEIEQFQSQFARAVATGQDFRTVRVIRDLRYARYGDRELPLDLYLPETPRSNHACVITVTGGGFRARGKDAFARYAALFAARGFAAACIAYRGTPDDGFPETIHDCKAAVRFVRANASRFGIDPDRIGIFGQSAGGHLAGMLAVSGGVAELEGDGGNESVSSRVQAAVSSSGVFNFISRLRDGGHQQHNIETKKRTNGEWVGEPFSVDSELWKRASPITYLSTDDAPLMMLASKTDQVVPLAQSEEMHDAMQSKGLISELAIFEVGGHNVAGAAAISEQVWPRILGFFREHLNRSPKP